MKIIKSFQSIIILAITSVILLQSCNNKSNVLNNEQKHDKAEIINGINNIYMKFYRQSQVRNIGIAYIDTQKVNKVKAFQMGLADAIVGGLTAAASAELGPMFAAYAGLWGGFLASAAMADLYDKGKRTSITQPMDSSFIFNEGEIGNAHNDLLEKSIIDTNFKNLVISDTLSKEVILLFVSNNYFNTNNINLLVNQLKPMLISNYNEFISNVDLDSMLFNYNTLVINNSHISSIEKSIIITISNEIQMLEPYSYTSYLKEVENLINNDMNLNNSQKGTLLKFIGILNSSIKFWLIN
jgi:hypothetical protein